MRSRGDYDAQMTLWWIFPISSTTCIGKKLIYSGQWNWKENLNLRESFSDTSLSSWRTFCDDQRARRFWLDSERYLDINCLELIATFIEMFAKDLVDCEILLRIDNTTAIAYVNRMGSISYLRLNHAQDI